jgi:hypothetical protein
MFEEQVGWGPMTMMPLLEEITSVVDVPVAALPVPYHTHEEEPSFQSLRDPRYDGYLPSGIPFPTALDPSEDFLWRKISFGPQLVGFARTTYKASSVSGGVFTSSAGRER